MRLDIAAKSFRKGLSKGTIKRRGPMLAKRLVAVGVLMFAVIVTVVLGLGRVALAQTVNGTIHGTVTDATGAAIPDVSIQVTNLGNGLTRTAVSNSSGFYTIDR